MDVLDVAVRLSDQIPDTDEYQREREFCWLNVGRAAIALDDTPVLRRALAALGPSSPGAELRMAMLRIHGPLRDEVLDDFQLRFPQWQEHLRRREMGQLLGMISSRVGLSAVIPVIEGLDDPFTRVSSFVDLADRTRDPVLRRSLLLDAWRHAAEVAAGHDYALKHVAGGFIEARHFRDARTAIDEMRDPSIRMDYLAWLQRALADAERHEDAAKVAGELDRTLDEHPGIQSQSELLGHAEDLLKEDLPGMEPSDDAVFAELGAMVAAGSFDAAVAQIRHRFPTRFCPPVLSLPADLQTSTLVLQLETVATRRRNDLKVEFVCDLAAGLHGAGITLPDEAGAVLVSPALLALEPPATPPIMSRDLSQLTLAELVTLLFDRPVANTEEERRWMERTRKDDAEISDEAKLVRLTTRLFRDFGTIASRYSPEQVDQGLWLLLSYPGDVQMSIQFNGVPEDAALEWVEAAYHVFAGYVARRELPDSLTAFYMFWDLSWRHTTDAVRGAALRTLTRVLELPDRDCRVAALHGLNHLHPHPGAAEAVAAFLAAHGHELTPDDLAYAEGCLTGSWM